MRILRLISSLTNGTKGIIPLRTHYGLVILGYTPKGKSHNCRMFFLFLLLLLLSSSSSSSLSNKTYVRFEDSSVGNFKVLSPADCKN